MSKPVCQGDIIKLDNIDNPVLVVSKDFFNESGEVIGCPITGLSMVSPLHIRIIAERTEGYVQCEKMRLLDLRARGYSVKDRVVMAEIMDITDAIQSIFDCV